MVFLCNSCFICMEIGQMSGEPWIMTSCFHIFCKACSCRTLNKVCAICSAQCKIVQIGKDMPPALKALFEPPLAKIEKIQHQLRFLQQQQEIAFNMKKVIIEAHQKRVYQMQKIVKMEEKATAEHQRLEKAVKEKMEMFKQIKEKYVKLKTEEQRLRKYFEEHGYPVDKDLSADSGMFSFEKSCRF